jgi:hypothetical protein
MRYFILITTAVLAMLFYACEPNISTPDTPSTVEAQQLAVGDNGLLLEETLLDKILLPIGTKVIMDANDPAQIQFELPDGYAFLTLNVATGKPGTILRGSYSCSCTGGGSCTVLYTEQGGFGCLHGTCSGSCTGKPTTHNELNSGITIVGVINSNNDILTTKKATHQASFSPGGLDAFFQLEEVVQQINERLISKFATILNIEKPCILLYTRLFYVSPAEQALRNKAKILGKLAII